MNLSDYFENAKGYGILSTADSSGKVNAAVYARPHFFDENTIAFIMRERLTHENLNSNPHAAYLFIESKPGYSGKRLYLTKLREETNDELVASICRRCDYSAFTDGLTRHVVFFTIDKALPLIGAGS
ncbi:MAG: pyridoxamine 5'-phosphate oxidase family protein [Desulfomonilaceae bacterium]|nr:pyridoxamine 5'-phosphate oxidase family protein [Desulfomonilaceae bacterium]